MNKKKIRENAIRIQESVISHLEELITDYLSTSDIDENETKDPEDFSHQNEATEMILNLKTQLQKAKMDLNVLESLSENRKNEIGVGSLVETDKGYFYVSIPTVVDCDGEDVVGVSMEAPLYKKMRGKKKDEMFYVGENEFQIISVS